MVKNAFFKLFLKELKDLYSAEQQLIVALPKMVDAASTPELKEAFQNHFEETQNQVVRLEDAFVTLKEEPTGETCKAMQGLIKEGEEVIKSKLPSIVKDAALIGAAQRVEHYEIAGYGVAKTFAKLLDFDEIADLLDATLDEEKTADENLTSIAEGGLFTAGVNKRASEM